MSRRGQQLFGWVAIVAGVAIVVAVAAGITLPTFVLMLIPLVVLAAVTYYWVEIRPAPTGVRSPGDSPIHEEDPTLEGSASSVGGPDRYRHG